MKNFAIFDISTGKCLQTLGATNLAHANTATVEGLTVALEVDALFEGRQAYLEGEAIKTIPDAPTARHTFNWSEKKWVDPRTIADLKQEKNLCINQCRLSANQSHFVYAGKQIAADPLSRSDIDAVHGIVTLTNEMPIGWQGAWKAIDNTYVTVPDVAAWTMFYKAMVDQGTINFNHSQTLKAQLAAATTAEEVEAIVW